MKVLIADGTGQVGQILKREYLKRGYEITILTRNRQSKADVYWDGKSLGDWKNKLENVDVLINLAGRSVNCRYTQENLQAMLDSRVQSTQVIGEAVEKATNPPKLWLQMSTATIYAHSFDKDNDEDTGHIGGGEPHAPEYWDFSIKIAKDWEKTFFAAPTPHTRKVALRSAMVMSVDKGGVFRELSGLAKKGLGGSIGGGKQHMSWIHEKDFIGAIDLLIDNDFSGVINLSAPENLPQKDFMRVLRHQVGMPLALPATKWMAEIGAFFMRTDTELVLKSRRVYPKRLIELGYQFQFPTWKEAAHDLAIGSKEYMSRAFVKYAIFAFFTTHAILRMVAFREASLDNLSFFFLFIPETLIPFMISTALACVLFAKKIYRKQPLPIAFAISFLAASLVALLTTYLTFSSFELITYLWDGRFLYSTKRIFYFPALYAVVGYIFSLPAILIFGYLMARDSQEKMSQVPS